MAMRDEVEQLAARRKQIRQMGGPERIEKQHARGKLTARERLAKLFDGGQWTEVGIHGKPMGMYAGQGDGSEVPADAGSQGAPVKIPAEGLTVRSTAC